MKTIILGYIGLGSGFRFYYGGDKTSCMTLSTLNLGNYGTVVE